MKRKVIMIIAIVLFLLMILTLIYFSQNKNQKDPAITQVEVYENLLNMFNDPEKLAKFGQSVVNETCQNPKELFRCIWVDQQRCQTEVQSGVQVCLGQITPGQINNQGQVIVAYESFKGCLSTELKNRAIQKDLGLFTHCAAK